MLTDRILRTGPSPGYPFVESNAWCLRVYVVYMGSVMMLFGILLVSGWLRRPRLQLLRLRGPKL